VQGVELLVEKYRPKGRLPSQTPNTCMARSLIRLWGRSSMVAREKAHDRKLRPLNLCSVLKVVITRRQIGGWLRGSHPLKSV
jgi:hypothetical protein